MPKTNLANLIHVARDKGSAYAGSHGSWMAIRFDDGRVTVDHYNTHMITVTAENEVIPISRGWGSVSDRQGISRILGFRSGFYVIHNGERHDAFTYHQVYDAPTPPNEKGVLD